MEQAAEILVIITSSVLVLFLLVSIFLLAQIIIVVKHLKRLAERAETVADSVESIGAAFQDAAKTRKVLKLIEKVANTITTKK
jgi:biopolymer transport protein ExbB/TolQ